MAFVRSANLNDILVTIRETERTFDDATIDAGVAETYRQAGYDDEPKSKAEADAQNKSGFNGLQVTAQDIETRGNANGETLLVTLAPTRYRIRDAMVAHAKKHGIVDHDVLGRISPRIMGVSIIAPIKIGSKYFIVGQIKGDALGSGDIHAGYIAGGVRAKDLKTPNPLLSALTDQTKEESGVDRNQLSLSSFKYLIDERETGQINIGAVARGFDFAYALAAFKKDTMARLAAEPNKKLEVNGFAPLPVAGLTIIPVEKGRAGLKKVMGYFATPTGIDDHYIKNNPIRPFTKALITHFADKRNVKRFLEYGGL